MSRDIGKFTGWSGISLWTSRSRKACHFWAWLHERSSYKHVCDLCGYECICEYEDTCELRECGCTCDWKDLVYKEGFLLRIVFFSFHFHATSCILFGQ